MARRRSSSRSTWPTFAVLALAIGGAAGWFFLLKRPGGGEKDSFHGLTALNADDFRENAKSLQGNLYQVKGLVEDQLGWSAAKGRVLSVNTSGSPLGLHVPPELSRDHSIETGQTFLFKVRVGAGGMLVVEDLKKI